LSDGLSRDDVDVSWEGSVGTGEASIGGARVHGGTCDLTEGEGKVRCGEN
jgi:hypothetical protein